MPELGEKKGNERLREQWVLKAIVKTCDKEYRLIRSPSSQENEDVSDSNLLTFR